MIYLPFSLGISGANFYPSHSSFYQQANNNNLQQATEEYFENPDSTKVHPTPSSPRSYIRSYLVSHELCPNRGN